MDGEEEHGHLRHDDHEHGQAADASDHAALRRCVEVETASIGVRAVDWRAHRYVGPAALRRRRAAGKKACAHGLPHLLQDVELSPALAAAGAWRDGRPVPAELVPCDGGAKNVDVRVQRISLDLGAQLAELVVTFVAAFVVRRRRGARVHRRRIVVGAGGGAVGVRVWIRAPVGRSAMPVEKVGHVLANVEPRAARVVRERRGAHEDRRDVEALALEHGLVERVETNCAILDGLAVDRQLPLLERENDAWQHLPLPVTTVDAGRDRVVSLVAARLEYENEGVLDGRLRGGGA